MKKYLTAAALLIFSFITKAQKIGDSKILVKVSDTSDLYHRVKLAIIKNGYIVQDDENKTILTSNVIVKKHLGYTRVKAQINGDTVIVKGFYALKNQNLFDIEIGPGKYNKMMYYNERNFGWYILYGIATDIDADNLSYSK